MVATKTWGKLGELKYGKREVSGGMEGCTATALTGTLGCLTEVDASGLPLGWPLGSCESEDVERYPRPPSWRWCASSCQKGHYGVSSGSFGFLGLSLKGPGQLGSWAAAL